MLLYLLHPITRMATSRHLLPRDFSRIRPRQWRSVDQRRHVLVPTDTP